MDPYCHPVKAEQNSPRVQGSAEPLNNKVSSNGNDCLVNLPSTATKVKQEAHLNLVENTEIKDTREPLPIQPYSILDYEVPVHIKSEPEEAATCKFPPIKQAPVVEGTAGYNYSSDFTGGDSSLQELPSHLQDTFKAEQRVRKREWEDVSSRPLEFYREPLSFTPQHQRPYKRKKQAKRPQISLQNITSGDSYEFKAEAIEAQRQAHMLRQNNPGANVQIKVEMESTDNRLPHAVETNENKVPVPYSTKGEVKRTQNRASELWKGNSGANVQIKVEMKTLNIPTPITMWTWIGPGSAQFSHGFKEISIGGFKGAISSIGSNGLFSSTPSSIGRPLVLKKGEFSGIEEHFHSEFKLPMNEYSTQRLDLQNLLDVPAKSEEEIERRRLDDEVITRWLGPDGPRGEALI